MVIRVLFLFIIKLLWIRNVLSQNKIVNEAEAVEGEFPFVVSIQLLNEHACDGSLVTPSWILSACHCTVLIPPSNFLIAVGGGVTLPGDEGYQVRKVGTLIQHPEFGPWKNGIGWKKDLALFETKKPFELGPKINIMKVFSWDKNEMKRKTNDLINGKSLCKVVWFETTNKKDKDNNTLVALFKRNTYLSDPKKCNDDLCSVVKQTCGIDNVEGQICAYGSNQQKSCVDDSGGPLICDGYVYGFASWGPKCIPKATPMMYSRIDDNIDFLNAAQDGGTANSRSSIVGTSLSNIFMLAITSLSFYNKNNNKLFN